MPKSSCPLNTQKLLKSLRSVYVVAISCLALAVFPQNTSAQTDDTGNGPTVTMPQVLSRGGVGTFGTQLAKRPSFVSINGYADLEFEYIKDSTVTFKQETVELFISAQLDEKISTEFGIQFEDGASKIDVEYAFFDYQFNSKAIFRVGKFYLPTSDFNEYRHKAYINRAVDQPLTTSVSPSEWSDTGVQLRGKFGTDSSRWRPYYAMYLVNGLQGKAGDDMETLENGRFLDNNKSKAFGAQVGLEFNHNFFTSVSYHRSKYDSAAKLISSITGISAGFDNGKLYVNAEFHYNNLDNSSTLSNKLSGLFALAAYRYKSFEPYYRYDQNNLSGIEATRSTVGVNYYLKRSAFLKLSYEHEKTEAKTFGELNTALVFTF